MDQTMLTLKHGTTLAERGGQMGIVLNGRVRFAQNARQAEILRALVERPRSIKSLTALLRARDCATDNGSEFFLAIAEFILDFGEYLEA
ncbi:hypothetical protein OBV_06050 [Oscillibacter valericigenes Sjm18-20]|nr:hypothetical protein OBV_06050 [Oscillibacter valericigenes Sjm18-20]